MSAVPQAERNKRAWLMGWKDGARGMMCLPRSAGQRDFYAEGHRHGAQALDRAHGTAKYLFDDGVEPATDPLGASEAGVAARR